MIREWMVPLIALFWLSLFSTASAATNKNAHLEEAMTLDQQGFVAESVPVWQAFLGTEPPKELYVYGAIKLSLAQAKMGRFLDAMKTAQVLANKYPDHFEAQFNLGNMMSAVQRFDQAVEAFKKVVAMRPQEGLGYVGLGLAYFGGGNTEEGVKTLRQARELFKEQKNISWYQNIRIMIGQMKSFAPYPPDFSNLWLTNNIRTVRDTYEKGVFRRYEETLDL